MQMLILKPLMKMGILRVSFLKVLMNYCKHLQSEQSGRNCEDLRMLLPIMLHNT
jgi:hypothetical protein